MEHSQPSLKLRAYPEERYSGRRETRERWCTRNSYSVLSRFLQTCAHTLISRIVFLTRPLECADRKRGRTRIKSWDHSGARACSDRRKLLFFRAYRPGEEASGQCSGKDREPRRD